jgi:hypothetical protein
MKPWIKTEISNSCEQVMIIQPNEAMDGIQLTIGECDLSKVYERFYINKEEMSVIIKKLQEMMEYVTNKE